LHGKDGKEEVNRWFLLSKSHHPQAPIVTSSNREKKQKATVEVVCLHSQNWKPKLLTEFDGTDGKDEVDQLFWSSKVFSSSSFHLHETHKSPKTGVETPFSFSPSEPKVISCIIRSDSMSNMHAVIRKQEKNEEDKTEPN
jgi:hypothetical protein